MVVSRLTRLVLRCAKTFRLERVALLSTAAAQLIALKLINVTCAWVTITAVTFALLVPTSPALVEKERENTKERARSATSGDYLALVA